MMNRHMAVKGEELVPKKGQNRSIGVVDREVGVVRVEMNVRQNGS